MRAALAAFLVALLATPTAVAWRADLAQPLGPSPRLADSLLVSGALDASARGASLAMPAVARADFGRNLTVIACPDVGGEPQDCSGPAQSANTHARIRVVAGGFAIEPQAEAARVNVLARSGAAMLTGGNLSANHVGLGSAALVGGEVEVTTDAQTLKVRPFGANVTLQVLGDSGTQTYNGTGVTLIVSNAESVLLLGPGVVLGNAQTMELALAEAPLRLAEQSRGLDDLFALARASIPVEDADRRADLATAFGPFQLVPAVINGAAAARANLTLNGAAQHGIVVIRLQDARLQLANRTWSGTGNASFLVTDGLLAGTPGARTTFPLLIPGLLLVAALIGRLLTPRVSPGSRARKQAALIRLGGFVVLALLAEALLAGIFGFHPLWNWNALSARSRAQTLLLVASVALAAYVGVGLATESLARSLLAWRTRPNAIRIPALLGIGAALVFLLISSVVLTSVMARIVRL